MSGTPLRTAPPVLTLLLLMGPSLWIDPPTAAAQTGPSRSRARVEGVVVDGVTYRPLDSAVVAIGDGGLEVTTGSSGAFEFPDAPLGSVALRVSAPGHSTVVQDLEVASGVVVYVQILLPSVAAVLSEILVRGRSQEHAASPARTAADLLALEVPRASVNRGAVGQSDYQLLLRQATSFQGIGAPAIVLDGVVLSRGPGAFEALERIPAADVEAIEVLSGPASAFLYPWAANGVVHVRTKRGPDLR